MRWFKFYGQDWLTDLKIRRLRIEDKICFVTLMCLASTADEAGLVRNCTEEDLISLSNLYQDPHESDNEYTRALGCLKRYKALQIVTLHDNGDVTINAFDARQTENTTAAERQKKYRERLKTKPEKRNARDITRYNDSNARIEEKRRDKNRVLTASGDDGFNSFWSAYPRKIGKSEAGKAWQKLKPDLAVVLTALETQTSSDQWQRDGGKFIPHPTTWLNQKRWEDEVEVMEVINLDK